MTDGFKAAMTANSLAIALEDELATLKRRREKGDTMSNRQRRTANQTNASQLNWTMYQIAGMENQCQIIKNAIMANPRLTVEEKRRIWTGLDLALSDLVTAKEAIREANSAASYRKTQR